MTRWRDRAWLPSRIGLRLLAFNLLVVFVPVVGVLSLDVYEARLLDAQEREMVQQGRVLAAAIAGNGPLDSGAITRILMRFGGQSDARFRVYDAKGALLADSATTRPVAAAQPADTYGASPYADTASARSRMLYRIGASIAGARQWVGITARAMFRRSQPPTAPAVDAGLAPEIRTALEGRYGAATRRSPGQRSLTLFSAVPVRDGGSVVGVVVVSESTFRILRALYDVRLRIFQVVVASVLAAALMTTLATTTIVRPLRRLRRQALRLAERRGPLPVSFPEVGRRDELGDLARALEELARRLNEHIGLVEGFAADVSHEFKNPLASIRTAAEMIGELESPEDRQRFLTLMLRDVDRLERLVSGVRDMARIDGELELGGLEPVRVGDVLREVAEGMRATMQDAVIAIDAPHEGVAVRASRERLAQVFENLLSNAISFAPAGTAVEIAVTPNGGECAVTVSDRGPGIPEAHLQRVFERFFTYRPVSGRGDHVGLGLAIARRVIEGYGGALSARNRDGGGACFEVRLPAIADAPRRPARASRSV